MPVNWGWVYMGSTLVWTGAIVSSGSENLRTMRRGKAAHFSQVPALLPLPLGEGWGEGAQAAPPMIDPMRIEWVSGISLCPSTRNRGAARNGGGRQLRTWGGLQPAVDFSPLFPALPAPEEVGLKPSAG